jgi:hypothetical protein
MAVVRRSFAVTCIVYRFTGRGSNQCWKRGACAEAQPGSAQCNATILPQRLHGSLLDSPDRRRAGPELSEAKSLESLASVPERREGNRAGYARSSGVEYPCDGPSCACAKCAGGGGTAARHCAAKLPWHKQAQPSATQKCPPSLRRRVQNTLRRYSAGRCGFDRLFEAQRNDFIGSVSAGTGGRCWRYERSSRPGRGTAAG